MLRISKLYINTIFMLFALSLAGCAGLPSSGPLAESIKNVGSGDALDGISVVDIDKPLIERLLRARKSQTFAETFRSVPPEEYRIGKGDMLEVNIWEAPPATLFVTTMDQAQYSIGMTQFPKQEVRDDGTINIPFCGAVPAAGYTSAEVEKEIIERLKKKANQPQVMVRVTQNVTSNVKLIGEFETNLLVPLSPKGEKLLDVIAVAGGLRQPLGKVTLQLARGSLVRSMPMEKVLEDPAQNVYLEPDDIITALNQPLSLTMLGAIGKNEEQSFETGGVTLAQALARSGGLQDMRADAKGIFVFRQQTGETPEQKPTIYGLDMKDPASIFLAQGFTIEDKDVVYVSNAPTTDLAKFLDLLGAATRAVAPPVTWSRWW